MKENKYLENIEAQIKKGAIEKALDGLILYAALIKNQNALTKALSLNNRHKRLSDLEQKGLVHLSAAAYLHTRISNSTIQLMQSLELETTLKQQSGKNNLVLNIKEKEIGKEMLGKLKSFFQKEFGLAFNVLAK